MITLAPGVTRRSNAVIAVGGLQFGVALPDGTVWDYDTLQGWWDPAPERDRIVDRPDSPGGYDAVPLESSRIVTVSGSVHGSTRPVAAAALQALAAVSGDLLLEVDDPDLGYRWCQCRKIAGQADASTLGSGYVRWQLQLKAPDYRKYGAPVVVSCGPRVEGAGGLVYPLAYPLGYGTPPSGGQVTVVNAGTAASEPLITVSSPGSPFTVTHVETSRRLSYLSFSSALTLDCFEGVASEAGEDRTRWLVSRQWFRVEPGESATFALSPVSGSWAVDPWMSVQLAPAYV